MEVVCWIDVGCMVRGGKFVEVRIRVGGKRGCRWDGGPGGWVGRCDVCYAEKESERKEDK